jgi:FAD/FMN-containing dehydrogenase
VFSLGVVVDEPSAALVSTYLRKVDGVLEPYRVGEYPNFVESPADASRFFGPETWARLRQVKGVYDPGNLFRGNHCIPMPAEAQDPVVAQS